MTIRRQLYASIGISVTVVLVVFITLFLSMRQFNLVLEKSGFAADIDSNGINGLRSVTVDYLVSPQGRSLVQWQQRHASLGALLATDLYQGSDDQVIVERLRLHNDYLGEIFPKLANLYAERRSQPEQNDLRREVEDRLVAQIMLTTQDMVSDTAELMRHSHEDLHQVQRRTALIVSILVATLGLLILVNMILSVRNILNPIRALQRGTEIIGAGNLRYRTGITLANEIGALSGSFDAMAAKLAQAQADVQANAVRLEEAVKELDSFSYSVSHDLRAPLRGIDGWSLALLEDYGAGLDATAHQYLDIVRAEAQHMGELIDDLLQLSRVTRGDLRREPVDLSNLAQTVAKRLKTAYPQRNIEFLIEPGLLANADAKLLQIALTNLLDNACKFTGTRPIAQIEVGRALETDPQTRTQRTVFFVRDNGVGFDMVHAARLFDAFERLHAASEFPGTGIGLATVQRIVRRHGGRIWAEGRPGEGASFYFTLEAAS